jgi:tripartite-type tricarboxylate transporter receptor subunit TctC
MKTARFENGWYGCMAVVAMCIVFLLSAMTASADGWKPKKEIKLIVTSSARGYYNAQGRILAKELESMLDTPVYVDNVPGGNMVQGVLQTQRAKPDGYTICLTGSTHLILNQLMFKAKYDVNKLVYLGRVLDGTNMTGAIFTTPKAGLDTWEEMAQREKPVRWAAFGKGTVPWLSTKVIVDEFNLKSILVEGYVGFEGLQAVARGEVDAVSFPLSLGLSYVKKGEVGAVMTIAKERHPELPDVPTCVEKGHPELTEVVSVHHIVIAPPNLPADITKALQDAVFKAASSQAMKDYHQKAIEEGKAFGPLPGDQTKALILKAAEGLKPYI